jgi:hypothetical protein
MEAVIAHLGQMDKVNFVLNIIRCRRCAFNIEVGPFPRCELLLGDRCRHLPPPRGLELRNLSAQAGLANAC